MTYVPQPLTKVFQTRASGISYRQHLLNQGVTNEECIRAHLAVITRMMTVNPSLDIRKYRVDENNPNAMPAIPQMG